MEQKQQNPGITEIDVHGMTKYQAKIFIDSQLKKVKKDVYRLRVIHGYHGGTELKKMIVNDYKNHEKVIRIESGLNIGITDLVIREFI